MVNLCKFYLIRLSGRLIIDESSKLMATLVITFDRATL